jgi:hypothetical protein
VAEAGIEISSNGIAAKSAAAKAVRAFIGSPFK